MGLGGLAPSAVLVRVLVLSAGKTYQGRAATPVAQLAADVTAEAANAIKEYIASLPIDPMLDKDCIIRDNDESIMGTFGYPTKNGYYCEEDGFRVPIGHMLLRDQGRTRLCRSFENKQLRDCLLERHGNKWVPVRRPQLTGSCEMYDSDGTYMGRLGTPTEDGRHCRTLAEKKNGGYSKEHVSQEHPIGELFYTDTDRSRVCVDAMLKHCFMKAPAGRNTLAVEDGERFTSAYLKHLEEKADKAAQNAQDVAGGKITLTTMQEEVTGAAESAIKTAKDPKKAVQNTIEAIKRGLAEWQNKTPEQKLDSVASGAAGLTVEAIQTAVTSGIGGVLTPASTLEKLGEAAEDVTKASRKLRRTSRAAGKAEAEVAEHATPPGAITHTKEPHRNRADHRPATSYEKVDENGIVLKHGVTHHEDPRKRYTKKEIGRGQVNPIERGPRQEMLKKERRRVETDAGIENHEPWAGKDTCE